MLTPEEKTTCMHGQLHDTVKQIMAANIDSNNSTEVKAYFVFVRNYLMPNIFVRNGHRTGVVSNMTLQEFESVKFREGRHLLKLLEHKTNGDYGYANVVILKTSFQNAHIL